MTTRTLTGSYAAGYTLTAPLTTLSIAATGYVSGTGLIDKAGGTYTIVNQGQVETTHGADPQYGGLNFSNSRVYLTNGGVTNTTALIEGYSNNVDYGVVSNFGSIVGDSRTGFGLGSAYVNLTNGSAGDTHALIQGGTGVSILKFAQVVNYGEILGNGSVANVGTITQTTSGVYSGYGGSIKNGSSTDTGAVIRGAYGVYFGSYYAGGAAGVVTNFGMIEATPFMSGGIGIAFTKGGAVTNGSASDEGATIEGPDLAIRVRGGVGSISNFGTIEGTPGAYGNAMHLYSGGSVTNGSSSDHAALIQGVDAITVEGGSGTVSNSGEIRGAGNYNAIGVALSGGGSVTNGSSTDTAATIYGYAHGIAIGGAGTVVNDGSILSAYYIDVGLYDGGRLTNGSTSLKSALIRGGGGLIVAGAAGTVSNFGTIAGEHAGDWGALVESGGSHLTNGATTDTTALISGYNGVYAGAGVTVTNFGVISGDMALELAASTSELLAEPGSKLEGEVSSVGRIDVVSGVATITGGLMNGGAVEGAGTLALTGGTSQFDAGSALSVDKITVLGAGTVVEFEANVGDGKIWTQTAGTIGIGAGDKATFSGTGNSFSGVSITGAGALAFTAGTDALIGDTLFLSTVTFGAAKVTVSGVTSLSAAVINTGTLTLASGTLTVNGAVTGAGTIAIGSGVADFTSTFTENVTFTSTTGILELAKSQTYAGTITGFSKTGTNSLDLGDIAFGAGTKATYSGTATSGTLTVTDGTHTAKIKLSGNYTTSTFTVSSDGHGGTKVVDPTNPSPHGAAPGSSTQLFIDAMAGFGARGAPLADIGSPPDPHPMQALVRNPPA